MECRDVDLTEKLDYSSAVALLGYSLILAILRTLNVRDEAARVMVAAPLLAFVITHILYLNFYKLDYGTMSLLLYPDFWVILKLITSVKDIFVSFIMATFILVISVMLI